MGRYFSRLSKRTGIAANNAGDMRRQTARLNIRPAFQSNKTASINRGLEANVEKIAAPTVPQRNSVTEFSVREAGFSQPLKADPVKKDIDNGVAEVRPDVSEMTVHAQVPPPGVPNGEDQRSRNMPEGVNQPNEPSSETTAVKKDEPDNVVLIEKQQYIARPENRGPRQNHLDKSKLTPSLKIPISKRHPKSEEKTTETKTIRLENEIRQSRESGDDSFFEPGPYTETKETPSTSPAAIEPGGETRPHRGTRAIHIISERGRTAEMKLEKADPAGHDNSVDIHIGTISFEVHQAPGEKTVTDPLPPIPRPVVIQQTHSPKTPSLSRYYLRGM